MQAALAIGVLAAAMAFIATPPAQAAGETLNVVLTQVDGTAPFNADSDPGRDANGTNGIVRTNDNLTYNVEVQVQDAAAANVTFTLPLPQGVELSALPPYCSGPGSSLTPVSLGAPAVPTTATSWTALPAQTLVCNVGARTAGSTFLYPVVARVRPEVPNGTTLTPVVANVVSTDVPTPVASAPVNATVSARAQFDVSKVGMSLDPATEGTGLLAGGSVVACGGTPPPGATGQCFRYTASVLISTVQGGKGVTPMATPLTFTDDLSPNAIYGPATTSDPDWIAAGTGASALYGARLVGCPASYAGGNPNPRITGATTAVNSVRDSGTMTCTQPGGPGTPVTITVTNMDSTAYTYPSQTSTGASVPASRAYVFSRAIEFQIPVEAVRDLGATANQLTWDNKLTNFDPVGLDGVANRPGANLAWNDHIGATAVVRTAGSADKFFVGVPGAIGNTPRTAFVPGNSQWEGPSGSIGPDSGTGQLFPGQTTISNVRMDNTSTSGSSYTFVACDSWDSTLLNLTSKVQPGGADIPGTGAGTLGWQDLGSNGVPVWLADPDNNATLVSVEYGTGPGGDGTDSRCDEASSPSGWTSDPAAVPGNDPALASQGVYTAVSRVRMLVHLPVNARANVAIGLRSVPGTPVGTKLPNWANFKGRAGTQTLAAMLGSGTWGTNDYDPEANAGNPGDRLITATAAARLAKTVEPPSGGGFGTTTPQATGGQLVRFRLSPTLNAAADAEVFTPVVVEDCLPADTVFVSATPVPNVVQPGSPAGAGITCTAGQTYVMWDLGPRQINVPIPPITYSIRVKATAVAGIKTNRARVTAEGDSSPTGQRTATAAIQVVQPAGIKIDKVALTPLPEINRDGETTLDPLVWEVSLANIDTTPGPSDIDLIDVLPAQGLASTDFDGTLTFDHATVLEGDLPGQSVEILYTGDASIALDAADATNHPSTGSTTWCSLSGSTFTKVLGAGTTADCPGDIADVTGLRIRRPGEFATSQLIRVEIGMVPTGNSVGDVYVNQAQGRATGLVSPVGPVDAPETVVGSTIGNYVWDDANLNGIQDAGEAPIEGFTVTLEGTDTDGNTVGPLTATTDVNGLYTFTGLQSGSYTVTFEPASLAANQVFTIQNAGAISTVDSDGDITTGAVTVDIAANTSNLTVDQGVFTAAPGIEVTKFIDGDDANATPGVLVEPGDDMEVTFEVRNTGNLTLDPVTVTDDTIDSADITCPQTSLRIGETMTCTATFPAPDAGVQHTNLATATGTPAPLPDGTQLDDVDDDDPANAYGRVRQVSITKDLTGAPVPNGDGTYTVTYDIVVTNEGTQAATYDLDDGLQYGWGATIESAAIVASPGGVALEPGWNGVTDQRVATGVGIGVDETHTYRVQVVASVGTLPSIDTSSNCVQEPQEAGTGFLNGATLTAEGAITEVEACEGFPITNLEKDLIGAAVPNGDGTYTIRYLLTVTNTGGLDTTYDLVDELQYGGNINVESAAVTNTAPGTITPNASWDGLAATGVVTDQPIAAGDTHTYEVTVVATGDPDITYEQTDCKPAPGDGDAFFNSATLSVNGLLDDESACAPVPNIDMTKELAGEPVVESDGTVTVRYVITVANTGAGTGTYDLSDELQFGDDITVNTAAVIGAPLGQPANPAWNGTSETAIATDRSLGGQQQHQYIVEVNGAIGVDATVTDADCTLAADETGTGFLNSATLTVNGEVTEDDACGEVEPVIDIDKAIVAGPTQNADGTWEIGYDVTVTNTVAPNTYDLIDELSYGAGIEVEAATVANTVPGDIVTNPSWNGLTDVAVVDSQEIGAGGTHTYRVVVTATVSAGITAAESDCSSTTGGTGTGFLNTANVTTDDQSIDTDACAAATEVTMSKELVGAPTVNDDNTVDLTYAITVSNVSAGQGQYDLEDELQFGNDISVNTASVINSMPGDIDTNPSWNGASDTEIVSDEAIRTGDVHVYTVTVNATVGTETTIAQGDCTLDEGEAGTGFLNNATLIIDDHRADDDACGEVEPVIEVEKTLVGSPTANGDGTWTIDYEIEARNVGPIPGVYDLTDRLAFGQNVSVVQADVENTDPGTITANPDWDGINQQTIVTQQELGAGVAHRYGVTVVASVAPGVTVTASDCELTPGEDGTGFLNQAELSFEGGNSEDDACGEIPNFEIVKTIKGTPQVSSSGAIEVTYLLTVTNGGEGDGEYDLSDEIRWGDGLSIDEAAVVVVPAGNEANPRWNGTTETLIAEGVGLVAGGEHVWEVRVRGQRSTELTGSSGDCKVSGGEAGTGLLNTAEVESNGRTADSSACEKVDPPAVTDDRDDDDRGGWLPHTGSDLAGLAIAGLVLVAGGLFFLTTARRRRNSSVR